MKKKNLLSKWFLLTMALIGFTAGSYAQTCPSGMISYWRLQEADGNTYVDEKGNHDAITSTSPAQTAGISGKALLFSSSNLSVSSHANFNWAANGSFTIELWVKYSNLTAETQVFIGRDDPTSQTHWWIGKTSTGRIEWYTRASDGSNGDVTTTAAYNNGQWHHIVAVRDGGASKNYLYVDGVLQNAGGTTVTLTASLTSTADINIGNLIYNNNPMYYFDGAVDEVALYNVALASGDITTHHTNMRNYQIGYCSGNAPELFSTPELTAVISQTYNYDVDGSGNPLPTYSIAQGPTGMTIDAVSGMISWTPSTFSQNAPVVVRATNSQGTVEQSYNIFLADVPDCRENLIAYWDFNKTGSAPYSDNMAGYQLTGTGPGQVTGMVGKGLAFDGVNDSLNMADPEAGGNIFFDFADVPSFSIEVWVKSSASPSETMVLVGREEDENNTQYWLGVNTNGTVGLYLRDYLATPNSTYLEGGSVLDGAWHHIVATYNATTNNARLYVDKIMVDDANQNFGDFGGNNDLNIGCLNTALDKFWYQGIIDELAFYNVELPVATITANYDAAVAGNGACILNYAPLILTAPVTAVNEDAAYNYKFIASELNPADVVTISMVTKPDWMTFSYVPADTFATLGGIPANAAVGTHDVTIRVSDGSINVDQTYQVTVTNVNDAPTITSTPVAQVNEDSEYTYTVVGEDLDEGSTLTYSATTIPEWLSFDAETHVLSGTPTNDEVGMWDITVAVSDGTVSVPQEFQLTVNNVNDLPEITTEPVDTIEATIDYMYQIEATDVDEGDVLTFSAVSIPSFLTFTPGANSGILSGTPTAENIGTHAIILKVNDGHGDVMQGFSLVVTNAPVGISHIDNSILDEVYPNPASDFVYFRFATVGKTRIELYDLSGKLHKLVSTNNDNRIDLNISDLAKGIYIYKAYQNNKLSIGKISKE